MKERENDSPNWQGSLTRWRNWKLVRLILCLSTSWQLNILNYQFYCCNSWSMCFSISLLYFLSCLQTSCVVWCYHAVDAEHALLARIFFVTVLLTRCETTPLIPDNSLQCNDNGERNTEIFFLLHSYFLSRLAQTAWMSDAQRMKLLQHSLLAPESDMSGFLKCFRRRRWRG